MKNTGYKKYPTQAARQKGFAYGKNKFATETQKHRIENVFFCVSVSPWQKIFPQEIIYNLPGKITLKR